MSWNRAMTLQAHYKKLGNPDHWAWLYNMAIAKQWTEVLPCKENSRKIQGKFMFSKVNPDTVLSIKVFPEVFTSYFSTPKIIFSSLDNHFENIHIENRFSPSTFSVNGVCFLFFFGIPRYSQVCKIKSNSSEH